MEYPAEFAIHPDLFRAEPVTRHILSMLPLGKGFSLSVATGRSALMKALDSLPKESCTGTAWLPSLCCASLASPFLDRGFSLNFYSSFPRGIPPVGKGDVFLYIHFCGFPNRQVEEALDSLPKKCRPFVIEDCVHALFTSGVGLYGDFTIYSFRKFLPVPDGGLLLSRTSIDAFLAPPLESFISAKAVGRLIGSSVLRKKGEEILDEDPFPRAPSEMGRYLLDRAPWEHIPEMRRKNFGLLAGILRISPVLPEGTVPLGMPVLLARGKGELERRLRAEGLRTPVSWEENRLAPSVESSRLAVLPCDERMGLSSLERVASIARPFLEQGSAG